MAAEIELEVDGARVTLPDDGSTLLGVLRDRLGRRSVKDGCSPQGQCGCCTVLVDGQPRVACVTPARRVQGRSIVTLEGLAEPERARWAAAFCETGGSQCGFCTPGIIVRLAGLEAKKPDADEVEVRRALAAHLCRCTGWQTIVDAWHARSGSAGAPHRRRDLGAAADRARIEGRNAQRVGPEVALGMAGFADDSAPVDALVAVRGADGAWVVGESVDHARAAAGKVQGRRTTLDPRHPLELPEGDWAATLRTTWIDPAYLETDAAWAEPGGEPSTPLANGGAFGAKRASQVGEVARRLADEHDRPVRVLYSREDAVRLGPKRPPVAGGVDADGRGVLRVVATEGIEAAIAAVAPDLIIEQIAVDGDLATSADLRAAGWAEATALLALARGSVGRIEGPDTGWAEAEVADGRIAIRCNGGEMLDEVVLRSYCIGAAHMGYSWVTSESLAVDDRGAVHDLTIRSFGVTRATDTPTIDVELVEDGPPVNVSDAVFAAVAAATALHLDASEWPHRR